MSFRSDVKGLPTNLLDNRPRGPIAVHDPLVGDRSNHGGDCLEIIVMPHHQKAAADQVVNFAFLFREVGLLGGDRIGDNGMMVAHFTVVHIPLSQSALPCSRSHLLPITRGNCRDNA